jgi:carbamoyltransferase
MIILGIHAGQHEASATLFDDYRVLAAVQMERLNRIKGAGVLPGEWAWPCVDEVLSIHGLRRQDVDVVALTRSALPQTYYCKMRTPWRRLAVLAKPEILRKRPHRLLVNALRKEHVADASRVFAEDDFLMDHGFRGDTQIHWFNHHFCHALPGLFFTDWSEGLLYTADGIGDNASYSARSFGDGKLTTLFGDDDALLEPYGGGSVALAYGIVTQAVGFRMLRHEGKLTGLAASGEPVFYRDLAQHFAVDERGQVRSTWVTFEEMRAAITKLLEGARREDAAASIQKLVEDIVLAALTRVLSKAPHRHLGLSGGLFANVKLNHHLADNLSLDEIFIVPPMGDEGLSLGAGLGFLLSRDGLHGWLEQRYRLDDVYWGRDYDSAIDAALIAEPDLARLDEPAIEGAAARLADGQIGAIFRGRMEFGPRALGARSILANPSQRATHDELNRRLQRSEFMPFAPVVTEENAGRVFEIGSVNRYACRFMTITTQVLPEWRRAIEAVVHVDGSARPQIIRRDINPLYHDIVVAFERRTGIPALINTSFNVHEEPIVNRPAECVRALLDRRIDFVVTENALYTTRT